MLLGYHFDFENEVPLIYYFVCGWSFYCLCFSLSPSSPPPHCVCVCVIKIKLTAVKMSRYNVCGELEYTTVCTGKSLEYTFIWGVALLWAHSNCTVLKETFFNAYIQWLFLWLTLLCFLASKLELLVCSKPVSESFLLY